MECMICFDRMNSWTMQRMPGCSHSVCVDCANRMQETLYDNSTADMSDDESDDSEYGIALPIDNEQNDPNQTDVIQDYPVDYTIKVSIEGYKITRVYYHDLEGFYDPMRCPYCRQHGPMWYDFGELRRYVPSHTSEWNMLERKLDKNSLTSYTMKQDGATFAFKLIHDKKILRVMWSEINQYEFTRPGIPYEKNYVEPVVPKCIKDSRSYSRKKTFTKMAR
jgi:hypothetical protein